MVDSKVMTVNAYAKINLFLEVKEKLENGYHNLETVMQSVTLCDTLTAEKKKAGIDLECVCEGKQIKDNIVIKAALLFFERSGIDGGVDIKLIKRIPVESGLGGGSSDAAATLYALNTLYGGALCDEVLYKTAKDIGADVPFCLKKGLCYAEGIGEILTDTGRLPDCHIVITVGSHSVSTKKAFEELDRVTDRNTADKTAMMSAIERSDLSGICDSLYNCFELVNPASEVLKRLLLDNGALAASLSGSGPSVFGIYDKKETAERSAETLKELGYKAFICRPYYRSDEI